MRHVVWDWNGTLVADLDATVEAINVVMATFGGRRISPGDYRRHYQRPVRAFYEYLFERQLDNHTWVRIDELFHSEYSRRLEAIALASGAREALAGVAAAGHTQSLLSMWLHDQLLHEVDRHGIAHWFVRVDGNRPGQGDPKSKSLGRHLETLGLAGDQVVVVGDALDDVEAARTVGARAVLVTSTHQPERLRVTGVPVVDRLVDVLAHL
jgi:phosphoglycolate phosphatase-like HAD superfamily hydrolase